MQNKTLKALDVVLCIAVVGAVAYFVLPTLLSALAPFILAYILSLILEPLIRLLTNKLRLPRGIASCVCTLLAVGVIGGIFSFVGVKLWAQIVDLAENWPSIYDSVKLKAAEISVAMQGYYTTLSPDVQSYLSYALEEARSGLLSLISPAANWTVMLVRRIASNIPAAIIFIVVQFLACHFICAEKAKLRYVAQRIVGVKAVGRISAIWHDMKSALGGYVKAQLMIMCVAAVVLSIGFAIARIPYFLLIALAVAVLDALPVFGSGAVLIPWAAVSLFLRDYKTMVIMLVLYIMILITRQILEPRIVGKHIGVPPLLTLIAMYAGLNVFGIFGMILGPVLVLILKNLYLAGVFDRLLNMERPDKTKEKDEEVSTNE